MTGAYVFAAFIFFIFLYVFATLFTIFKKKKFEPMQIDKTKQTQISRRKFIPATALSSAGLTILPRNQFKTQIGINKN